MASGLFKSLSAAKLCELKSEVVELLQSCDGHRMDLGHFKKEYKDFFGKKFEHRYGMLKSKKLKNVMAELDDVISLVENLHGFVIVLKDESGDKEKDKEFSSSMPNFVHVPLDSTAAAGSQQVETDFKLPPIPLESSTMIKSLQTDGSSNISFPVSSPSTSAAPVQKEADSSKDNNSFTSLDGKISNRVMLKARRRVKKDSTKETKVAAVVTSSDVKPGDKENPVLVQESLQGSQKIKDISPVDSKEDEPTAENVATAVIPQSCPLTPTAASLNILPLPSPSQPTVIDHFQVTPPQVSGACGIKQASPSFLDIMEQQAQEERLASEGLPCSPFGSGRSLKEMQGRPSTVKRSQVHSTTELRDSRAREIGTPGPFEKSIEHAQQMMSVVKTKPTRNASILEVNRAVENIITSLAEDGQYVSLEVVKAKLCKEFGKSNFNAFGFKRDRDIPALHDLIQLQNRVSLFVHAYVMSNSIATLYELNQSLADLGSKPDFEDLKLGPLLQQPVVYDMFKAPLNLPTLPRITTIQILKHLERYMTQEDLWRKKVDLKKFLEYLCEEHDCETPYELGVRIQSVGLAISVIKQAKKSDSERWKAVREKVSVDMDEELERRLRKIKKDLLGKELGDLRSCVMKLLDASPVDALKEIFNCSMELFEGQHQKKISNFLSLITEDSLGRRLFQLALSMSCKRLLGDALKQLVAVEAKKQAAENERKKREEEKPLVPPSEGTVVKEVKEWLANADDIDLGRLTNIEANVVSKFPEFSSFEELGYGSFLRFLTSHKELVEDMEQVGGLARSGGMGTRLGYQVPLNSVLEFISQCGAQISAEITELNLCTYYGISKVTELGYGSCSNLLKKVSERNKKTTRISTPLVAYEASLVCHHSGTKSSGSNAVEAHHGGVLGYMSKEDAIAAIQSTPLLEDVALWTHWNEVFGGSVSKLGDLKSFLENEGILMNAGKSSSGVHRSMVVMETSPGVLIRVTTNTSPEIFKDCACRGDAIGAAGHLVSMVMVNCGVANTPVALLANHVQSSLASMASPDKDGYDRLYDFVLKCLVRMPRRLSQAVGTKVFLEPLKKLVGSTEAPALLLSRCSTHSQRTRLHQLGFALGISQWIEDFHGRVSSSKEDDLHVELNVGVHRGEERKRPIGVVRPVACSTEHIIDQSEESVSAREDDMATGLNEASVNVQDEEEDSGTDVQKQPTSFAPSAEQEEECRKLIEQIRREDFGIGIELGEEESKLVQRQREREGRGLHRLSTELYSKDTHFVLELVQNADDNSYPEQCSGAGFPSLAFILERDRIVVLNNEAGFMENNIRALCDVGRSTKGAHRYGYIGQKGIGFKSVFRVSDCPEVHSNGYRIRFDAKSGPIGYILPQWIEERTGKEEECEDGLQSTGEDDVDDGMDHVIADYGGWSTRIVLPLNEGYQGTEKNSLAARFRDVHPSLLLFLHRLRAISIHDQVNNSRHEMIRKDLGDNIMEVSHTNGTDRWLVIKKQLDASNMKEDVEMTELAVAFPLFSNSDQDTSFGRRHQTLPQQNVFAYLPLRSYGFRFIIQGDFEVPSSREDVDGDKSWNQWLREEIPQLFVDALSVFMDHSSFPGLSSVASYFQFVPLEEEILDFFTPVARHILTLLQAEPCIPVQMISHETGEKSGSISYEWVIPCKAIFCQDSTVQELITPALLEEHLGLRYLHPDIVPALNPTLRSRLGIETLSTKHLIEIGKAEANKFSAEANVAVIDGDDCRPDVVRIRWLARWLQCIYRCLEQERNSSQDILDLIGSLGVIPLTDGTFVNLNRDSVFLPLSMKKVSEGDSKKKKKKSSSAKSLEQTCFTVLEKDLSTVHPNLFTSLDDIGRSQVEQLLRRLGVKSWSAKELINSHIIPTFNSDRWKTKSNEVLRSYLIYILEQRLNDPSLCDIDELRSCVQILTNKGTCNPVETPIHFTPKFGNTIDLARQLPSISWTLVDESYLDSCAGLKACAADWKAFLTDLGVQNFLAIKRKQVKLHRNGMAQSPWASYELIWQTTPDGLYIVDDWACEEFEEFLDKIAASDTKHQVSCSESKILAQCIDERWEKEYSEFADSSVQFKDTNGHVLGETKSSFYLNLVSKPWMSARGEMTSCFIPRDLFMWSEPIHRLLEDHVKYTAADLKNSAFIHALRIRESISVDDMISKMKKWSNASGESVQGSQSEEFITSVAHMSEVYSFLLQRMSKSEEEEKRIKEAFRKNALIFVPDGSPKPFSKQSQTTQQLSGSFCLKKDVCWRDPTDVAGKLLNDHGKVTTRHLLEGFYSHPRASAHQSLSAFFVDQLNVDETPNIDEYIEMASTVAEVAGFPTPTSMSEMLKIFSTLGKKCIARGHNDNIRVDNEIKENMATFLKQSLEREQKCIFPSFDKWVSLSDKPLLADDKSLLKIFQKEKGVYFLDLGELFQPQKQRSSRDRRKPEKEEMKQNVSLFLKICEVKALSECIVKEFIPTLVQYQCVPLQKYFHQLIPSVQRFLHTRDPTVYVELNRQRFAQKLLQMQFASVESLETLYSLSTHPDVRIPVKENSGVQTVGSSFCLYVVQEFLESADVLNVEMVKLLLGEKKQGSSDLSNFLVAVRNYDGSDFESFLEEVQGLEPLPGGEELWCVPPPEEPDIVEVQEEDPMEVVASLHTDMSVSYKGGDDTLHSWPPKSAAQYDKTHRREGDPNSENTLKMWPPPAPPDSMKIPAEEQVLPVQCNTGTQRPSGNDDRARERVEKLEVIPPQHCPPLVMGAIAEDVVHQTNVQNDPNPPVVEGGIETEEPKVYFSNENENGLRSAARVEPQYAQAATPGHGVVIDPGHAARQISPSRAYLWFDLGTSEFDFEDLSFHGDMNILDRIPLAENPNKEDIGRWGEQCVFEFLRNQAQFVPPGEEVEIIWMNENGNTTAPYDLEIRRRLTGKEDPNTVVTYVEVKATSSDQNGVFEISVPELQFALAKKEALHLYRVFNAGNLNCLRIRRLQNLAAQLERKNVKLCVVI